MALEFKVLLLFLLWRADHKRASDALFWPLWVPTFMWHTHININKNKPFKNYLPPPLPDFRVWDMAQ